MALSLANIPAYPMSGTGTSSRSSSLDFAISIPRIAELRILCAPSAIRITAADVERGSVDIPLAWCIEIRANRSYEISFTALASWVESASLRGLPATVEVRDGTGRYEEVRPMGSSVQARLGATLHLAPGTAPGNYAWPLAISLAAT